MSKMSQLHAELSEQAFELGFESLDEALVNGYEVDYEKQKLVDGRELAHEDWKDRKEQIIQNLMAIRKKLIKKGGNENIKNAIILGDTISFIKEGEI